MILSHHGQVNNDKSETPRAADPGCFGRGGAMLKITIGPAVIEVPGSLLIYTLWLVHH